MNLSSSYMGMTLRSPLVASASPLSHTLDGVRRLADGGAAAVILHSLFEEDLLAEAEDQLSIAEAGTESFAEALTYFPDLPGANTEPRRYLSLLERSVQAVDVPVLASLNAASPGGWARYAQQMEAAGAAGIELNLYNSPAGPAVTGRKVEDVHMEILALVKAAVGVPVAVKMSPFYSSVGEMASRFAGAGADALVLFNRFVHADIDTGTLAPTPGLGLSSPADGRLPRTWVALLRPSLSLSLGLSSGAHSANDLIKGLLAGADTVMTTSALLIHGPGHSRLLLAGLTSWMATMGYDDVSQFRGLLAMVGDGRASERALYVDALRAANAVQAGAW